MMGRVVYAPYDAEIIYADANKVIIKGKGQKEEATYRVDSFQRTSQATAYTQRTVVKTGQKVKKGELLIDGPASQNGELALGQNLVNCLYFFRRLGI